MHAVELTQTSLVVVNILFQKIPNNTFAKILVNLVKIPESVLD